MDYWDFLKVVEDLGEVPDVDDLVFAFFGGGGKPKRTLPFSTPAERAAAISEIARRQSE